MTDVSRKSLRILLTGKDGHGSNALGLARAFRRLGHIVQQVSPTRYEPSLGKGFWARATQRLLRPVAMRAFERAILEEVEVLRPDLMLAFKGNGIRPDILRSLRRQGVCLVNFYPDVSFMCHGDDIREGLPLYDRVFTTKTFGIEDMRRHLGIESSEFLPHGFDPDLHRPLPVRPDDIEALGGDASFIGTWSPKKEALLGHLAAQLPDIRLRVWGAQWDRSSDKNLESAIAGRYVVGDTYPLAICASRINIGILSEARPGASSGDRTTARTFETPACGGFMLHERTDELLQFFEEGKEVACFGSPEELVEKARYYLAHEDEREAIRMAGHRRCVAENSLEKRAARIAQWYRQEYDGGRR